MENVGQNRAMFFSEELFPPLKYKTFSRQSYKSNINCIFSRLYSLMPVGASS